MTKEQAKVLREKLAQDAKEKRAITKHFKDGGTLEGIPKSRKNSVRPF